MAELLNNNLPELEVSQEDLAKQEEIKWTVKQTKDALNSPDVNPFYKKNGEKYVYNLDTVKKYLTKLQNKTPDQLKAVNTGAWIMAVQVGLKALKYDVRVVDWVLATKGNFSGSETVKIIAQFQADNGLDATGVPYGPTIKKLLEKLGGAVSGPVSESSINNTNADGKIKLNQALDGGDGQGQGDKIVPESPKTPESFEQSAVGKVFEKLGAPATWLSSKVVQAWKKQAEDYFKDKNPKEYKSFSPLDLANWKWIYYDPDQKDIQIGIFQNKFLQEGIVLQKDKVLFITWQRKSSEKPLFDEQIVQEGQSPQQENEQALKLQKRATLSEKITAIGSGKISWVKAGSEKSLKELAIGDRGDLKNLEIGLAELKTLISANQEFIMSDEGLRLELTNSLNDIKAGLESKNRGWLNGTKIKEHLLKEVNGLISIFSSQEKIPDYNKEQDSPAARIWVGAQVKEEAPSSSVQQKVEKVTINPNVDPIQNYSDLFPGSSTWTTRTPDKEDQEQKAKEEAEQKAKKEAEQKAKKEAEQKAKKEAEQKAKKEAEQKAKKEAEQKAKKEAEQKAKKEAEQKAKKEAEQKAVGGKETVTASKEFTRDSKFEDLATLSGDASNLKFEFNKGVLQTDGNGKYILINGEKYYEYTDDESRQNPALKYFDLNRNHPKGIELQFWGLDSGYVQPDFSFVPEK